ncbi:thioredoxin family protein [Rasiella sp. SM2506]|uniref:thioredoxin family protein n=1 Tax=Rasiella sp. SM2506 TaxID=3423914 RepID=UPI003D7AA6D3
MKIDSKEYVHKAISYPEYKLLFKQLVKEERTTGNEQSREKIDFTKLNWSRTKRLDKTVILSDSAIAIFKELNTPQTWLVITETWCGDAAQTLPFLNKIAALNENINLKLVLRDENEELMNSFLTNGSQSIPKLIILDSNNHVIDTWGPRSSRATQLVNDYKKLHGQLDADFKKALQIWYNNDEGVAIIEDLISVIKVSV